MQLPVAARATLPITIAELNGSGGPWVTAADWLIWLVFMIEWLLVMQFPPGRPASFTGRWSRSTDATGKTGGTGSASSSSWSRSRCSQPAFQLVRLVRVVRLARIGRATAVTTGALRPDARASRCHLCRVARGVGDRGRWCSSWPPSRPATVGDHDIWSRMWWRQRRSDRRGGDQRVEPLVGGRQS